MLMLWTVFLAKEAKVVVALRLEKVSVRQILEILEYQNYARFSVHVGWNYFRIGDTLMV